ncbi:unnamed protein product [Cyprideis torosa]|uniref:Uncharacterized protein n=1 Tax=Cyprideis torosa TaxID=163714 RepID=A0A7R8W052_9CRUS|nr:unnamed protein product [Cyprideis torosa]CAG0879373.1 unnamed protein product [Cyprideis torosa]
MEDEIARLKEELQKTSDRWRQSETEKKALINLLRKVEREKDELIQRSNFEMRQDAQTQVGLESWLEHQADSGEGGPSENERLAETNLRLKDVISIGRELIQVQAMRLENIQSDLERYRKILKIEREHKEIMSRKAERAQKETKEIIEMYERRIDKIRSSFIKFGRYRSPSPYAIPKPSVSSDDEATGSPVGSPVMDKSVQESVAENSSTRVVVTPPPTSETPKFLDLLSRRKRTLQKESSNDSTHQTEEGMESVKASSPTSPPDIGQDVAMIKLRSQLKRALLENKSLSGQLGSLHEMLELLGELEDLIDQSSKELEGDLSQSITTKDSGIGASTAGDSPPIANGSDGTLQVMLQPATQASVEQEDKPPPCRTDLRSPDDDEGLCPQSPSEWSAPKSREFINISRAFLKIHAMIQENQTLRAELNAVQEISSRLSDSVVIQERRLSTIADELSGIWDSLSTLRCRTESLNNAESFRRYELGQKREVLARLRQDLEASKECYRLVKERNLKSEKDWLEMRKEWRTRKSSDAAQYGEGISGVVEEVETPSTVSPSSAIITASEDILVPLGSPPTDHQVNTSLHEAAGISVLPDSFKKNDQDPVQETNLSETSSSTVLGLDTGEQEPKSTCEEVSNVATSSSDLETIHTTVESTTSTEIAGTSEDSKALP